VVAGFLFESGWGGLLTVSVIMATGSVIAAIALSLLPHSTAVTSSKTAGATG
jgi:hypothetical protein